MAVHFLTEQSEVDSLLPKLMEKPAWGADSETTGLDPHVDKVVMLSIGRPDEQYVIDTRKTNVEPLRPFFESKTIKKIGHHFKFDYKMFKGSFGIDTENVRCTMLAEQILNTGKKFFGFGLDDVLKARLGIDMDKTLQKSFIGHKGDFSEGQIKYAADDAAHLLPLCQHQAKELGELGLGATWVLECEALPCFGDMEFSGLKLDADKWRGLVEESKAAMAEAKEKMDGFAANFFNVNLFGEVDINYDSPPQVVQLLQRMKIKVQDLDREGNFFETLIAKSDDATLKKVKNYPIIKLLKDYRGAGIRVRTFGEAFIEAIHKKTGVIHPEFSQIGTETGRPANGYKSPVNMLNIPRDKRMRNCFLARYDDWVVETDDFSGCELRIWAEISRDPELVQPLLRGDDLHCYVATKLYGRTVTKTENKELRTPAKSLNFGIAYGMGGRKLYWKLNGDGFPIELTEAVGLYQRYIREFKVGVDFLRSSGRRAASQGWLANLNGRRRWWILPNPDDLEKDGREKYPQGRNDPAFRNRMAGIEREGGNFLIQSVNADMTKRAMAKIRDYKKKNKVRTEFMNQVYDEIVTTTHKDDSPDFVIAKRKFMLEAAQEWLKTVPMEVDGHVLPYWTK